MGKGKRITAIAAKDINMRKKNVILPCIAVLLFCTSCSLTECSRETMKKGSGVVTVTRVTANDLQQVYEFDKGLRGEGC